MQDPNSAETAFEQLFPQRNLKLSPDSQCRGSFSWIAAKENQSDVPRKQQSYLASHADYIVHQVKVRIKALVGCST